MIKVRVPQNSIKGQSFLKIVGVKKTYRIAEKMYEILFSNRWSIFNNKKKFIKVPQMQEDLDAKTSQEILRKNNLCPIRKLGRGGFGTVYLVSRGPAKSSDAELFAVKCTNKKNFSRQPLLRKYLRQEIDVQGSVKHSNIVKLIRAFDGTVWLIKMRDGTSWLCNIVS